MSEDQEQQEQTTTELSSEMPSADSGQASDAFEPCGAKHPLCTVGLGECNMRDGHESWGESHWCNKCGSSWG